MSKNVFKKMATFTTVILLGSVLNLATANAAEKSSSADVSKYTMTVDQKPVDFIHINSGHFFMSASCLRDKPSPKTKTNDFLCRASLAIKSAPKLPANSSQSASAAASFCTSPAWKGHIVSGTSTKKGHTLQLCEFDADKSMVSLDTIAFYMNGQKRVPSSIKPATKAPLAP